MTHFLLPGKPRRLSLYFLCLLGWLCVGTGPLSAQIDLRVTEIFSGQAGDDLTADWFEIRNAGTVAWTAGADPDLYYDDESALAADADHIQGIASIPAGGYAIVLITGSGVDVTTFKSVWSAVSDISSLPIGTTDGAGLGGGGDAVTLWLGDPNAGGVLVDSATYPATDNNDGQSYDVDLQAFSTVGNASGAIQTLAGGGASGDVPNIASPGNRGPRVANPNAPDLKVDLASATPYLELNEDGPVAIGADVGDPTDPAATLGIPFSLTDADTPIQNLTVNAVSDNPTVLPLTGVTLEGLGQTILLKLQPAGIGFANITITISDPDGNSDVFVIDYAASDATTDSTTRFHYGASDGSTAQAIDSAYMWVADDEGQTIRLYDRNQSGVPLSGIDFNENLGSDVEIDLESSLRVGDTIVWMGSHTNVERSVLFSTLQSGTGAATTLTYTGFYNDLRAELIDWDTDDGHGLGAGFFGLANGLEIEGLALDPTSPDGALLAFRGPLSDGDALLVPVTNFLHLPTLAPVAGSAQFGAPIRLELGGRSFRSIECNDKGCLIVAGPAGTVTSFRLFTWSGNPQDAPELRAVDLTDVAGPSAVEGIVALPTGDFLGAAGNDATVHLIVDTGTFDYYDSGSEAKDLLYEAWKKFRSERVTLGPVTLPPIANPGDVVINEIMQNPAAVSDAAGEWFELYNATSGSIDLNGWILADMDNDTAVIDNGGPLLIAAGGYLVLGNNADVAGNGGVPVAYAYTGFTLGNGSDEIILIAPNSVVIDSVAWDNGATFPDPNGASMSLQLPTRNNEDGANWCVATTPYGDGDLGTPGAPNDCSSIANLQITEIWMGQDGADLTADWFEIKNTGTTTWTASVDGSLYYDDESADPAEAVIIEGIDAIEPGEAVIVLITENANDVTVFRDVWSPVIELDGVAIGTANGAGLGGGGDLVTLWLGDPATTAPLDTASYPDTEAFDGQSYDVSLMAFSVVDNANMAVRTLALGGNNMDVPNIGSPGDLGPVVGTEDWANAYSFTVYPNPTPGRITLEGLDDRSVRDIQVLDASGRLVLLRTDVPTNGPTLDLSSLPAGRYYLRVAGSAGVSVQRVLKQ